MTLEFTGGRAPRPGFPVQPPETARWSRRCTAGAVTFGLARRDAYRTPRVWSGHGLGLPEDDLAAFAGELVEVMRHRPYWSARAACPDFAAGDAARWSPGRFDDEDGFVYFAGPCANGDRLPGYHPARSFTIPLPLVRGLRIRLAAYLAAAVPAATVPAARGEIRGAKTPPRTASACGAVSSRSPERAIGPASKGRADRARRLLRDRRAEPSARFPAFPA